MNLQPLTQVLSAPDVHHHVVLSQLLKVFFVHDKQATRYHGSPAAAKREKKKRQIKGLQDGLALASKIGKQRCINSLYSRWWDFASYLMGAIGFPCLARLCSKVM